MIAQLVFDLPIDGPFDYLVPEHLAGGVTVGCRVRVSFGRGTRIGFVVGLIDQSAIARLKPVGGLADAGPVFNELDLEFAKGFGAYYGCSLGEALTTVLRNKKNLEPSMRRDRKPVISLYRCPPDEYAVQIQRIMAGYPSGARFLVLVPDAYRAQMLSRQKLAGDISIGKRSCVFESDGRYDCVIMVDDEDASYKQEQSPMYETRQVLLARCALYGFDVAFVGVCPSVELMAMVREKKVLLGRDDGAAFAPAKLVDLANYKFVPGLVSPPVRLGLESALKAGRKSLLVLNVKGSYRLTRCVDCSAVLKCARCDSPLYFSRSRKKYICRHCTFTLPQETVCPACGKPSWRSQGIGIEQVQAELKKIFPQARIVAFERGRKADAQDSDVPDNFDILIATRALLRFQGRWKAQTAAFIDFDSQLNRLEARAAFNAFSLAQHVAGMADSVFIQTRNVSHYVLGHLSRGDIKGFYDEELALRRELGFSPFKHWIRVSWRGAGEKSTHKAASHVYNELSKAAPEGCVVTSPLADEVARKRDLFRFNVMVQADDVPAAVAFIKAGLSRVKRPGGVIVTINVDP
ncbi:MAG: hypothetical protein KGJ95_07020 [Candidatus Omnitrophica bacterium]|nr:hypothetical protein [Candidatus Omnitrophota bacterium]